MNGIWGICSERSVYTVPFCQGLLHQLQRLDSRESVIEVNPPKADSFA